MRLGQSSIFPSGETLGVAAMPEPSFTSAADKNDQQFEIAPFFNSQTRFLCKTKFLI